MRRFNFKNPFANNAASGVKASNISARDVSATMEAHRNNFAMPGGAVEIKAPEYLAPHVQVKRTMIEKRRELVSLEEDLVATININTAELQSARKAIKAIDAAGEILVSAEAPYDTHEVMSHNSMAERDDDSTVDEDNLENRRRVRQTIDDFDIEELEADIKAEMEKAEEEKG